MRLPPGGPQSWTPGKADKHTASARFGEKGRQIQGSHRKLDAAKPEQRAGAMPLMGAIAYHDRSPP
jgi:hypothetical protein